ncbi:hypothetical protein Tco_1441409, partial [Tanacetum coccineum]
GGVDLICDDDVIRGGEAVSDDVIKECEVGGETGAADVSNIGEIDVCMKIDGGDVNVNGCGGCDDVSKGGETGDADVIKFAEVGVCEKSDGGVIKGDGVGGADVSKEGEVVGDDEVSMVVEMVGEVNSCDVSVAKEVVDMNKSQSTVTSLRARRKVFKSPSSFSYRRLLPYLQDIESSNFEMVDAKLPEKSLKLGNNAPNMVAHGEQEISAVSVGINLTDEVSKSASEEQYSNKVKPEVSRNVESSDVVQKSHDDVLNDTLEECEQMTPPDADIYSKPKTDKMVDVVVKPKPKLVTPALFCFSFK